MADKSKLLLIDALTRAVADPAGVPLHGTKKAPGLFAGTAAARHIAQHCKDEGYLRSVRQEIKGKGSLEICAITEKGLAHLLSQVSPKPVLEALVRTLEGRQTQVAELVVAAQQWRTGIEALKATVERVLEELDAKEGTVPLSANPKSESQNTKQLQNPKFQTADRVGDLEIGNSDLFRNSDFEFRICPNNGADIWAAEVIASLTEWRTSGASNDCPLPQLYRRAQSPTPNLTIGAFHDGLRRLHDQGQVYLHPWTGPLYEIPEPQFALLIGHEIAYYASLR